MSIKIILVYAAVFLAGYWLSNKISTSFVGNVVKPL